MHMIQSNPASADVSLSSLSTRRDHDFGTSCAFTESVKDNECGTTQLKLDMYWVRRSTCSRCFSVLFKRCRSHDDLKT